MKEQRAKVDEIKKKTNYYITRELLQRYDESSPNGSPARPSKGMQPTTPQRMQPNSSATGTPNTIGANNCTSFQFHRSPFLKLPVAAPQPPAPTNAGQKQWYDKLAETILGDQDDTARYALICEECFAHNGLVKEAAWEDIRMCLPSRIRVTLNFVQNTFAQSVSTSTRQGVLMQTGRDQETCPLHRHRLLNQNLALRSYRLHRLGR